FGGVRTSSASSRYAVTRACGDGRGDCHWLRRPPTPSGTSYAKLGYENPDRSGAAADRRLRKTGPAGATAPPRPLYRRRAGPVYGAADVVGQDGDVTETPAPTRSSRSMRDLVMSLIVLLIPVAVIVAIFRLGGGEDPVVIDPSPAI